MSKISITLAAVALGASTVAIGQVTPVGPDRNLVRVSFAGTVTNDVTNTIQIRQPNGTLTPYTGPVPDYPYKVGDSVTVGFSVLAPNSAYYSSPAFTGQQAADGIYRINVQSGQPSNVLGAPRQPTITGAASVTGSVPLNVSGITLVYDANADSYSIELPSNDWRVSSFGIPGYAYNPTSGALTSTPSGCVFSPCEPDYAIRGTATGATAGGVTFGSLPVVNATEQGGLSGLFSGFNLSGMFNLPIFGGGGSSSGGGTQVPEPGMMFLFGGGAAALMARRRKKKVA